MSMKALVADDSAVLRSIIVDALLELGIAEVVEASDGKQALDLFQPGEFRLVVVDRVMPHGGGLGVTTGIRQQDADVPIIMITATGSDRDQVERAIEAGITEYLLKPFAPDSLRKKLAPFCQPQPV